VTGRYKAFIAYQAHHRLETATNPRPNPVSLLVVPESTAIASGGVEARYPKVSFHCATLGGFRVVTWSQHELTYALVSQESDDS